MIIRLGLVDVETGGKIFQLQLHVLVDQHLLLSEELRNFPSQLLLQFLGGLNLFGGVFILEDLFPLNRI